MDFTAVLGLALGNAAFIIPMFLWNRSESRADIRHMDNLMRAIQAEMKDFHNRLIEIEKSRK